MPQLGKKLKELTNLPIVLDNETCVYCGTELTLSSVTKEHVIGRRFVPKGKLEGQWNLIVRACKPCNGKKSGFEDDISAISMQADAWGRHALPDHILTQEAARKARGSISRRTSKPIKDSLEKLKIKGLLAPGAEFTFDLTAPPQIETKRIFELARMQLMAFFYLITYNQKTKRGGFWLGSFFPVLEAIRSDWGNPVHRAFMDAVVNWEVRVLAIGADGFFKVAIRRHPAEVCWSWALEWNCKYRIVGFFGEHEQAQAVANTFPPLEWITLIKGHNYNDHYRFEVALEEEKDNLFELEGRFDCSSK
jgi:hypothetical protein